MYWGLGWKIPQGFIWSGKIEQLEKHDFFEISNGISVTTDWIWSKSSSPLDPERKIQATTLLQSSLDKRWKIQPWYMRNYLSYRIETCRIDSFQWSPYILWNLSESVLTSASCKTLRAHSHTHVSFLKPNFIPHGRSNMNPLKPITHWKLSRIVFQF